jgi:threonine dehydrogenase-like Zn-dependent dehydrogenase
MSSVVIACIAWLLSRCYDRAKPSMAAQTRWTGEVRLLRSFAVRALVFEGVGRIAIATVPDPELVESTDVVVRTEAAGLCGSDLHVYRGRETGLDPGTPMGHELLGEVVAVGRDVRRHAIGDRVVSPFSTACGECYFCRGGLPARCARGQLFGWVERGRGLAGCQAELVRVPLADTTLVQAPRELPVEEALLVGDVLATGWFGAENGGVVPGASVAVIGCGAVGLCAAGAARELGAELVFAIDPAADRRRLAERFGAEASEPERAVSRALEATEGRGVDVVIEAVGSPEATTLAYELVRSGGTLSVVGVHAESTLAISPGAIYDKNLTYRSGRCPARALMERLLPIVAARRLPLGELVSHRLPLAEGPAAYAAFDRYEPGWTKVVFRG